LGTALLVDALLRSVKASQDVAVFAVRVDAIDSTARDFYLKYEFIPFQDHRYWFRLAWRLYLLYSKGLQRIPNTKYLFP
jgi:hypothetical protein